MFTLACKGVRQEKGIEEYPSIKLTKTLPGVAGWALDSRVSEGDCVCPSHRPTTEGVQNNRNPLPSLENTHLIWFKQKSWMKKSLSLSLSLVLFFPLFIHMLCRFKLFSVQKRKYTRISEFKDALHHSQIQWVN